MTISTDTFNIEGKVAYTQTVLRKEKTELPNNYYIFKEDRFLGEQGRGLIEGGITRAINVCLMRYEKELDLENTIILLSERINGSQVYWRIFVQKKKGWLFRMVSWKAYRATFGRAGDLPIEIVGITRACEDEILPLQTRLNCSNQDEIHQSFENRYFVKH